MKSLDRQRPGRARRAQQQREITFHARPVQQHRTQDRERNAGGFDRRLGGELGAAIGVGRRRLVAFGQGVLGGGPALRPQRRDEHQTPHAGARRRGGKLGRRRVVDAVVLHGRGAAGMGDAGEMDDLIDPVEQRRPIEALRKIRVLNDFDVVRRKEAAAARVRRRARCDRVRTRQRPRGRRNRSRRLPEAAELPASRSHLMNRRQAGRHQLEWRVGLSIAAVDPNGVAVVDEFAPIACKAHNCAARP